jgi:hypothetical protein
LDTQRNNNHIDAAVFAIADNVISFNNGLSLENDYSFSSSIFSSGFIPQIV